MSGYTRTCTGRHAQGECLICDAIRMADTIARLRAALERIAAGSPTRPWPHPARCKKTPCAWCIVRGIAKRALAGEKEAPDA